MTTRKRKQSGPSEPVFVAAAQTPLDANLVMIAVHQGDQLVWTPEMPEEESHRRHLAALSRNFQGERWPSWWTPEYIEEAKEAMAWVDAHPLPRLQRLPDGPVGLIHVSQATPEELAVARGACGRKSPDDAATGVPAKPPASEPEEE